MDPTVQVLLTIFGAAVVTAAAGFVGASMQARREHAGWVRERRLDAYGELLGIAGDLLVAQEQLATLDPLIDEVQSQADAVLKSRSKRVDPEPLEALKPRAKEALSENDERRILRDRIARERGEIEIRLLRKMTPVELLGPSLVDEAATDFHLSMAQGADEMRRSLDDLEAAMRSALRIPYEGIARGQSR